MRLVLFLAFLVGTALVALPSLLIGLLLWWWSRVAFDRREFWRVLVALAAFCAVVYGVWISLSDPLPWIVSSLLVDVARHLWTQVEHTGGLLWLFNLWLAPLVAPLLAGLYPPEGARSRAVAVPKQTAHLDYAREESAQTTRQLEQFARMTNAMQEPPQEVSVQAATSTSISAAMANATHREALGAYHGGELAELVRGGLFRIAPDLLEVHEILAGEPKAGKTTTLLRLAAIARFYGRKVFYVDLKGSKKTAALFLAAMAAAGATRASIYPLAAYDGWRGDGQALYNRLMQQIDPQSHPFYRKGVGSAIVSLAVHAPTGLPRNSRDFMRRLDLDWLETQYAKDTQALREIKAVAAHIKGLALVFAGFYRGINGALDGQWAFEDCDVAYIGIDGIAHREEAAMLGRYLLDDAAHYAVARKAPDEQALLIIDEFGVLESTNATGLYEQVREAGMVIYSAGQSYESFGSERAALLASSAVKILHRLGSPEPFVKYAGEREVYKLSRQVGGEDDTPQDLYHPLANKPQATRQGMMHATKEYAVPIEDVQQLQPGRIAYILGGHGAYVQVEPLTISPQLLQQAQNFVQQSPRFTPAAASLPQGDDDADVNYSYTN